MRRSMRWLTRLSESCHSATMRKGPYADFVRHLSGSFYLLSAVPKALGLGTNIKMMASLDHSMWFYQDFDVHDWILYVVSAMPRSLLGSIANLARGTDANSVGFQRPRRGARPALQPHRRADCRRRAGGTGARAIQAGQEREGSRPG